MTTIDPASGLPLDYTLSRRGALIACGVILLVLGSVLGLTAIVAVFGVLETAEQWLMQPPNQRNPPRAPAPPADLWPVVLGVVVMLAVAAGMVATGIGCCLARRWVRPVILTAAAFIIVVSLLNFITYALMLPSIVDALDAAAKRRPGAVPTPYAMIALFAIRGGVLLVVGVVLPYLMWRFFASDATRQTLDLLDPRTTWADRRPVPVLAWVALCGLIGLALLARLTEPALVAFTTVVKGSPAIIGLAAIGVLLAWGAWLCFRLDRLGWMITFLLLFGLRVSTAVFLWMGGDVADLLADARAAAAIARLQRIGVPPDWLWPTMATLEAVIIAALGLYAARYFPARYDVGLARTTANAGDVA